MVFLFNWEQGDGGLSHRMGWRRGAADSCWVRGDAVTAGSHGTPAQALEEEDLGFIYHLDVIAFSHICWPVEPEVPQHTISLMAQELEPPEGLTPLWSLLSSPVQGLGWEVACPVPPVVLQRPEESEQQISSSRLCKP